MHAFERSSRNNRGRKPAPSPSPASPLGAINGVSGASVSQPNVQNSGFGTLFATFEMSSR